MYRTLISVLTLLIFSVSFVQASPSGRSSIESTQVDPHSGSASLNYPLILPLGRGGIQPNINISYNSQNRNGLVGVGWSLALGSIHRSSKDGVPTFDDQLDTFTLIQAGSTQEVFYDAAKGFYRNKIEGAFLRIIKEGSGWQVTDKNGIKYTFGVNDVAREYDPDDTSKILRWRLESVIDVHGNYMTYSYIRDGNMLYPSEVLYTGNDEAALDAYAKVVFNYEDRSDPQCTYVTGVKLTLNKRLIDVEILADNNLQRRYVLSYVDSVVTNRSLLKMIEQEAHDGARLPATIFSYEDNSDVLQPYMDVVSLPAENMQGNNLWNFRYDGGYDRGHNTYGPCPPTHMCFGVNWSPTYTQASKSVSGLGSYSTTATGNLSFTARQDAALHWWTYVYTDVAKYITFNYQAVEVEIGIWVNGNYQKKSGNYFWARNKTWYLKKGYNLIEVTAYHQHQGITANLGLALANNVGLMHSERISIPKLSGDFNGDGFQDVLSGAINGDVSIDISTGVTFAPQEQWIAKFTKDKRILLSDVNADGRTDIIAYEESTGNWRVATSNGTAFIDQGNVLTNFGRNEEATAGDLNGDGYADLFTLYKSGGKWRTRTALNNGSGGFSATSDYAFEIGKDTYQPILGNFNGDGLMDFGTFDKAAGNWVLKLNTGRVSDPFNTLPSISSFGANKRTVIADFNADGLTDIGYYDNGAGKVYCKISNGGSSFGPAHPLAVDFTITDENAQVQASDFNGDSMVDWAVYNEVGDVEIAYSQLSVPDLLIESDNGVGGLSSIEYEPSTNYDNTYLPFTVPVVSQTGTKVFNEEYITRYFYANGLWDTTDREFRGFGLVRSIDPEDNYMESEFHQDAVYAGRMKGQRSYDSLQNLYSKSTYTWDKEAICPNHYFPYLRRKDNFVVGGVSGDSDRRTAEEFYYGASPQFGNITKAVQLGEVDFDTGADIGSDRRSVETSYVNNEEMRVLGLPSEVVVRNNEDEQMRLTKFYYDNATDLQADPVKGLLTKKEDWGGGGLNEQTPTTGYAYDSVGNLTSTTDPRGYQTSIIYDSTFSMFPLMTQNALAHQVVNFYYGVDGVALDSGDGYTGLFGQLKATTDPNNQQGLRVYDNFGRLVKTIGPLDSINFPTNETEFMYATDHMSVTSKKRRDHGQAGTIDAVAFVDGLGRTIQTKLPTGEEGKFIVNGQTSYDSRGQAVKKYIPFFSTTSLNTIDPMDLTRTATEVLYDAMGRVVKSINPDNTYGTIEYRDWTTTLINENGHKQESDFDAYGRLIQKREYIGADGRLAAIYPTMTYSVYAKTHYIYDSEGNLTQTIDAHNNDTEIYYDNLGRKISMDDPDMGVWTYQYDLNGNLTSQIDAKNQTIEFEYDALNRLTKKSYEQTILAEYTYDDVASDNTKGRLTQVDYNEDHTSFSYDVLGRETESIKNIKNEYFKVKRAYDGLNNLLNVEYPDQNKIFYKYNNVGQIEGVSNDESLLPTIGDQSSLNTHHRTSHISSNILSFLEEHILGVKPAYAGGIYRVLPEPVVIDVVSQTDTTVELSFSLLYIVYTFHSYELHCGMSSGNYSSIQNVGYSLRNLVNRDNNGQDKYCAAVTIYRDVYSGFSNEVLIPAQGIQAPEPDVLEPTQASNFTYSNVTEIAVTLNWHVSMDNVGVVGYNIYRNGSLLGNSTNTTFSDSGLSASTTYQYQVSAVDEAENESVKISLNVTTDSIIEIIPTPTAPTLNNIEPSDSKVSLEWESVADASGYKIYYGDQSGVYDHMQEAGIAFNADVENLTNGVACYFVVVAYNEGGDSDYSNELSVIPFAPPPSEAVSTLFVKDIDYNVFGQIERIVYGNGVITEYAFDVRQRLSRLHTFATDASVIQDLRYTYDGVGNILTIVNHADNKEQTFTYDALARLVEARGYYEDNGATLVTQAYDYDEVGNITEKDGNAYTYNQISAGPHAVTALSDSTTMTYDANGNMHTKQLGGEITYYTYDVENRLTKAERDEGQGVGIEELATYAYDGDGGRVSKDKGGQAFDRTNFVGSLYQTQNFKNTKYIFLGSQRVAQITDGKITYYHHDHLGGANVMTGEDAQVKEVIEYKPFGAKARHDKYGTDQEVAYHYFTGHYNDDETGLIFMQARYYDPSLGRFISADTIVQNPNGNPQTFNRYSYTGNNPVNYIDPTGHSWFKKFLKAAVIVVVGTALTVLSGGALGPVIGAYWTGIVTGAIAGATIGGTFAAATGGNIGMGMLTGAIGGAVFAGVAPGFGMLGDTLGNIATQGGHMGQMTAMGSAISNVTTGFLAGATSGAAVAGVSGTSVGKGALNGGIMAGATAAIASILKPFMGKHFDRDLAANGENRNNPDNITSFDQAKDMGFGIDTRDTWHTMGKNAKNNTKMLSFNKHQELVFSSRVGSNLVNNVVNRGTYNLGTNPFTHTILDIIPYFVYGNARNTPTTFINRLSGSYN